MSVRSARNTLSCSCRKGIWTSFKRALKAARRVGAERPYFCAEAGGYHITRYTREEWNAHRASKIVA